MPTAPTAFGRAPRRAGAFRARARGVAGKGSRRLPGGRGSGGLRRSRFVEITRASDLPSLRRSRAESASSFTDSAPSLAISSRKRRSRTCQRKRRSPSRTRCRSSPGRPARWTSSGRSASSAEAAWLSLAWSTNPTRQPAARTPRARQVSRGARVTGHLRETPRRQGKIRARPVIALWSNSRGMGRIGHLRPGPAW